MSKYLEKAMKHARVVDFDVEMDKYIVVSDQHLGNGRRGSDDFLDNREIYKKALNWYYEQGYKLIILGDGEELWETDFDVITNNYGDVQAIYGKFAAAGKLRRVYGNHDIFWRNSRYVRKFLPHRDPPPLIDEALLLKAAEGGIFLTHGHQGEFFSDKLWRISRLAVRWFWSPLQQAFGWKAPASEDPQKRNRREREYYDWARKTRLLFIAGHTHRAIFGSKSKLDQLRRELDEAIRIASYRVTGTDGYTAALNDVRKRKRELDERLKKEFPGGSPDPRFGSVGASSPCYFNSGCCIYDTGMTAIEIDRGSIRLVKWNRSSMSRTVYEEDSLRELFIRIALSS